MAIDAVLVANRGEIAVRIVRTLRRMGIRAIAVHSDVDADAPHVHLADEAVRVGPEEPAASYLDVGRLVAAARRTGADALHPGYGFLSENPALARACVDHGITFIGPPAEAIAAMADKAAARRLMRDAGVPVVPGTDDAAAGDAALLAAARTIGAPLIVKPVAGGGGKGMVVVDDLTDLPDALRAARRQADRAFGDDRVLLERFVTTPRHIEVQVLADAHGRTVHLGERECSLQRRHQKIVEETPSPLLDDITRRAIGESAVAAARACGYRGAGTVEYIVSADDPGHFHFLEMNTRLQVEHPVTEMVTGLDLVEWQVRIAAGEALPWDTDDDVARAGHAIEARVYAEDPAREFLPTGGTVLAVTTPTAQGTRVDSGIVTGTVVPSTYDPLLAKVVAHGADRAAALRRLDRALASTVVLGMGTNVGFLRRLLRLDAVRRGDLDTGLVGRHRADLAAPSPPDDVLVAVALSHLPAAATGTRSTFDRPGGWRLGEHAWTVWRLRGGGRTATVRVRGTHRAAEVVVDDGPAVAARCGRDGDVLSVVWHDRRRRYVVAGADGAVWIGRDGDVWRITEEDVLRPDAPSAQGGGPVGAPMPGAITAVHVSDGDRVEAGQPLVVMEAMKMQHVITAPAAGVVRAVSATVGDQVEIDRTLLTVE